MGHYYVVMGTNGITFTVLWHQGDIITVKAEFYLSRGHKDGIITMFFVGDTMVGIITMSRNKRGIFTV